MSKAKVVACEEAAGPHFICSKGDVSYFVGCILTLFSLYLDKVMKWSCLSHFKLDMTWRLHSNDERSHLRTVFCVFMSYVQQETPQPSCEHQVGA